MMFDTYFYFVRIIGKSSIIHCAGNKVKKIANLNENKPKKNEYKLIKMKEGEKKNLKESRAHGPTRVALILGWHPFIGPFESQNKEHTNKTTTIIKKTI